MVKSSRVGVDGKFFKCGGRRFNVRGVTYGTFAPRHDEARFPERDRIKLDFEAMQEAGFNTIRTYTVPPDDVFDMASDRGLRVLSDVFYSDWRYLIGASRREQHRVDQAARKEVRAAARRLAGNDQVLALSLGNEVPADVLRWLGTDVVAGTIRALVDVVHEVDSDMLLTYGNYPTAEYLQLDALDFLTFNVYLEQPEEFRRYLTRLQHLAGDRPLVLGELGNAVGSNCQGSAHQADATAWQLEAAIERGVAGSCVFSWTDDWWVGEARVEGWQFGLTTSDRSPRPALSVATEWNRRTVRDLDFPWPSITVVICAYNAETTLDECLHHTCELDYPDLEVVVVDDGSTDSTPDIVGRHPRCRLISIPHAGLAVARNEGFREARGELIAYLDSDAYPSPEWPYYLALGLDGPNVAGVGGPNLPPNGDPVGAHMVARAPGGPVHVLVSDDRAEHLPGCNMAFWKEILEEVGGFDPIYTAAGDDVDLCWKVLDRGLEIGFHPAALVWHHRRPGLKAYLRQQKGYGRSEALVEARNPDRFTPAGTARWRGRIYNSLAPTVTRQRIYRGVYGVAAYQSVYQGGGYFLDLVHQVGVPIAALLLATFPLAARSAWGATPALFAVAFVLMLMAVDMARTQVPRSLRAGRLRFRLGVAVHHLLQPMVRTWGRTRSRSLAHRQLPPRDPLPRPVPSGPRRIILLPEDRPRAELAAAVVAHLRRAKVRVLQSTGWDDYDARILRSPFVHGDLQTSSYPIGYVQLRIRCRLWWSRLAAVLVVALIPVLLGIPELAVLLVALALAETVRGVVSVHLLLHRILPASEAAR